MICIHNKIVKEKVTAKYSIAITVKIQPKESNAHRHSLSRDKFNFKGDNHCKTPTTPSHTLFGWFWLVLREEKKRWPDRKWFVARKNKTRFCLGGQGHSKTHIFILFWLILTKIQNGGQMMSYWKQWKYYRISLKCNPLHPPAL